MPATATATKIATLSGLRDPNAAVYRLDPPYEDHKTVVVSAVDLPILISDYLTSETMIFPGNAEDGITDFLELTMVPYKSHEDALADLGYEVAE